METLIQFKTAKLAQEKGFDTPCENVYVETLEHTLEMGRGGDCTFPAQESRVLKNGKFDEWDIIHCQAPSQSVLADWLRKENNIDVFIDSVGGKNGYFYVLQDILTGNQIKTGDKYNTFENSFEEGLFEALSLVV